MMMISDGMNARLSEQITAEFAAAHQYLAMACALDQLGYKILSARFHEQSDEEREHAMKILRYVLEVGGKVSLEAIACPNGSFDSVRSIVQKALDGERDITERINVLVALAESEKDYATRSFLNWFVDEQVEEVAGMCDLLNLVKLAGDNILQVESRIRHEMAAKS